MPHQRSCLDSTISWNPSTWTNPTRLILHTDGPIYTKSTGPANHLSALKVSINLWKIKKYLSSLTIILFPNFTEIFTHTTHYLWIRLRSGGTVILRCKLNLFLIPLTCQSNVSVKKAKSKIKKLSSALRLRGSYPSHKTQISTKI